MTPNGRKFEILNMRSKMVPMEQSQKNDNLVNLDEYRRTRGGKCFSGENWEIRNSDWRKSNHEQVDLILTEISDFALEDSFEHILTLLEISRKYVLLICRPELVSFLTAIGAEAFVGLAIWRDTASPSRAAQGEPPQAFQSIVLLNANKKKTGWNGKGRAPLYEYPARKEPVKYIRPVGYRTDPRPNRLYTDLILDFSEPGETVWDPGGTGVYTRGPAVLGAGRKYLAHESNLDICEKGAALLGNFMNGLTKGGAVGSQPALINPGRK